MESGRQSREGRSVRVKGKDMKEGVKSEGT